MKSNGSVFVVISAFIWINFIIIITLLSSSHQPSSMSQLLTSLSVFSRRCIYGSWLSKSLSRLWTISYIIIALCVCAYVFVKRLHRSAFARVKHNEAIKVTYLSLPVLCRMQYEDKSHTLHTHTSNHQPLLSKAGVCARIGVLMFAEVKVICQAGETDGWLCRGNW